MAVVFAQVMRWMEQCSYIAGSRIGRSGHLLTGSLDSLAFAQPTRVGDIMYITAQVWHSSPLSDTVLSCSTAPFKWGNQESIACMSPTWL